MKPAHAWWPFHAGAHGHSLKTRITLVTLMTFVLAIWGLVATMSHTLERELVGLLGTQQLAMASVIATEVEHEITERLEALEQVAAGIDADDLVNPAQLQRKLSGYMVFQRLFNGGSFVTGADGTAVATYPEHVKRQGINYLDRDYISKAASEGRVTIGRPVMGRKVAAPIVGVGAPIRDQQGRVIGVVAGVINLGTSSFLEHAGYSKVADGGSYLLLDAQHRMVLADTQNKRVMSRLPEPGANAMLDRLLQAQQGTEIFVNPAGVEVLASVRAVPVAGWFVSVQLPTVEAFAPIRALQRRLLVTALLLTALAGSLVWWLLSRELAPLLVTAEVLGSHPTDQATPVALPMTRSREIDQLIGAFNGLLHTLAEQQSALNDRETLYRTAFRTNPDAVSITRVADDRVIDVNESFLQLFGWTREEVLGQTTHALDLRLQGGGRPGFFVALRGTDQGRDLEVEVLTRQNELLHTLVSVSGITLAGQPCRLTMAHDVTERKAAADQIHRLAYADPLTQLPNRRLLMDLLQQSIDRCFNRRQLGALIFVDLDDFKTLNDTRGHDQGDLLLVNTARRLRACVRSGDTVARLGGDEFVVLLENLGPRAEEANLHAQRLAEQLLAVLSTPSGLDGHEHHGSASLGYALFGEQCESTAEPLKRAELAMYQAKASGRSGLCGFDPLMQAAVNTRVALEASLRQALELGHFVLHYQVQVDQPARGADAANDANDTNDTNNRQGPRVLGVEALLRWQDPVRGMVSPAEFIPVAESSGLIVPLGTWVLEAACHQLARWSQEPALARLKMSVNVSARQLHSEDFVDVVRQVLADTGAPPGRLMLELTESLLVSNIEDTIAKMTAIKALGVGFSLDDFGTGFSSLSYLKRLPLAQLKIDRSFVKDVLTDTNDMAIAKMVVALGSTLGLAVIAEGVETTAQREALAALGCTHYQGYLFGRPLPAAALEQSLQVRTPA